MHLDAPLGTTIPLEFSENGTVTGTAGRLAFYLGAARDNGRWWIADNRLCYRWTRWFNGEPSCMKIARQGSGFAWESDEGRTGTARIVQRRAVAAAPAPASTAPIAAAPPPRPATVTAALPQAATPVSPQRFALAGATASSPDAGPVVKTLPNTLKPTKPAVGPPLPARAALGGPIATSPTSRAPAVTASAAKISATTSAATKSSAAPSIARWDTKIEARSAAPSQRPSVYAPTAGAPQPKLQQPTLTVAAWRVVNVDEYDVLNIRAEPFSEAPVVGHIPPGGRGVKPLGTCYGSWCHVRWLGHDGWVHSAYVAPDGAN